MGNIVKSINQKLKQSPNESINVIFGETQTILSLRKPKKKATFKTCKLCKLYIKSCTSFKTPNNARRSHITYQSKNVKMLFIF